jgi:NADPH:quinone reductase-like Zn-dependent oxidoreductase
MKLMRAVLREGSMAFKSDYPVPSQLKPGSEEVLVKVRGAAINPADFKAPKMLLGPVVGLDFAGVVEAVAEGTPTHGLKVGDPVFGTLRGSLAEYAIADGSKIARKPETLSFLQAASLPTVYLTGLQALRDHGGFRCV